MADDPDERPSIPRAADWTLTGWLDFGIVAAVWAVLVAVWARAPRRRRHPPSVEATEMAGRRFDGAAIASKRAAAEP